MIVIANFILIFTALQLLIAFSNLVFNQRLKRLEPAGNPLISVLIPARNEEKNIGNLLNDLISQNYQNIEILVFDDESNDKTAVIAHEFSVKDNRVRILHSEGLPESWLGKNFGCHTLAQAAKGEYLLFLDADVRIANDMIPKIISFAKHYKLGLVSVFPKQIMQSAGEKSTIPVMNYILLTLLPLILVRKSHFPSMAAANGQFMFFNTEIYRATWPHKKMKSDKVEDIKIARWYKTQKIKIACLASEKSVSCRMYNGFGEAVHGFSKNVTQFFGNSFTIGILFWLVTTFGFVPVLLSYDLNFTGLYLLFVLLTRIFVSKASNQNIIINLVYLIPQQFSLFLFLSKALVNRFQNHYEWKGRKI